jgi:hypothetical protein
VNSLQLEKGAKEREAGNWKIRFSGCPNIRSPLLRLFTSRDGQQEPGWSVPAERVGREQAFGQRARSLRSAPLPPSRFAPACEGGHPYDDAKNLFAAFHYELAAARKDAVTVFFSRVNDWPNPLLS